MILAKASERWDLHKAQHVLKWTVYSLLLVNFGYYIYEDTLRATYTLTAASSWVDWTTNFATTIDEAAWFILLVMLELETYVLEDEAWEGWVVWLVRGLRIVCYAMILHTLYAASDAVMVMQPTVPIEGVTNLCELTGQDLSFVANLEYTDITSETCASLSNADQFFVVAEDPVVTDAAMLDLERNMALADLFEVAFWLIIVVAIELVVYLQERGVTSGMMLQIANQTKSVLFVCLIGIGLYWAWWSHWVYLWDELLWVCGFAAIGANLSEWREEIEWKEH